MSRRAKTDTEGLLTLEEHLEVLRRLLFRIITIVICAGIAVFAFKEITFDVILAPGKWDFVTYRGIERVAQLINPDFHVDPFSVDFIATDLTSQFMAHLTMALYIGILVASPYILYELFQFISPALYERERSKSKKIISIVYGQFLVGVLMAYFILFPVTFRFLGTYCVSDRVHNTITLDSYISTFTTLSLMMGLVFQLPVIAYLMAKMGIVSANFMARYRSYAFIMIMLLAAIITPPDVMTLLLVGIPLYLLYEVSIGIVRRTSRTVNGNRILK